MTEREHQVRDGDRTLKFPGTLLAESTSRYRNQPRWIEFKLFKTRAGSYVLSRVGHSTIYHAGDCGIVRQYNLKPADVAPTAVACDECRPEPNDVLYPERIRYWAQVMEQPSAVVEALMKYDEDGTRYLTRVAARLLDAARAYDQGIDDAYTVEHVA